MSRRSHAASTARRASFTEASLVTSQAQVCSVAGWALARPASPFAARGSRDRAKTSWPPASHWRANSRPKPRPAPVIRTRRGRLGRLMRTPYTDRGPGATGPRSRLLCYDPRRFAAEPGAVADVESDDDAGGD